MTDKEKLDELDLKYGELKILWQSEKTTNDMLQKHIENLSFQIQTQGKLLENFCITIADLRYKIKTLVNGENR
tara:strand:- start:32 stop:250 length:219 start_codon:yes stop_codon:yes gene_type:complete